MNKRRRVQKIIDENIVDCKIKDKEAKVMYHRSVLDRINILLSDVRDLENDLNEHGEDCSVKCVARAHSTLLVAAHMLKGVGVVK